VVAVCGQDQGSRRKVQIVQRTETRTLGIRLSGQCARHEERRGKGRGRSVGQEYMAGFLSKHLSVSLGELRNGLTHLKASAPVATVSWLAGAGAGAQLPCHS
jgi:hypothetical protein